MTFMKEDALVLKTGLRKAKSKPIPFFYCQAGENGDPVLIIDKRAASLSKPVRRSAQRKKFVEGLVQMGDGNQVIFVTEKGETEGKFGRNLKMYFGKLMPRLKKATIIHPDALVAPSPVGEVDKLVAQLRQMDETVTKDVRSLSDAKLIAVLDAVQAYSAATENSDRFSDLSARVEAEFTRRDKINEAVEWAQESMVAFEGSSKLVEKAIAKLLEPTEKNIRRKHGVRSELLTAIDSLEYAYNELKEALSL